MPDWMLRAGPVQRHGADSLFRFSDRLGDAWPSACVGPPVPFTDRALARGGPVGRALDGDRHRLPLPGAVSRTAFLGCA